MNRGKIAPIERPQSLCDIAATNIRNAIVSGTYGLGEALSENVLADTLQISKTPIREALSILKQEGLVTVVPQKGTFVFTMSVDEVAQLGKYRFALESTAIDMAMENNPRGLSDALSKIFEAMQISHGKGDIPEYLSLDTEYHETIFAHCGNKYLVDGYQFINGKIAAIRTHLAKHPTHTQKSFGEHQEMANLLGEGKINQAKRVLKRHVTRGERTYADGIEDIAAANQNAGRRSHRKRV